MPSDIKGLAKNRLRGLGRQRATAQHELPKAALVHDQGSKPHYRTEQLKGSKKADILEGGAGSDLLEGGRGADDFVLSKGIDRINDFNPGEGDRLVWKPSTFPLKEEPKLIQKGNDVVVKAKGKAKTIIENIKLSQVELYVDVERPEWSFETKDPVKDIYTDNEGNKRQRFTFSFTPQAEFEYRDDWNSDGIIAEYDHYFLGSTDLIKPKKNYKLEDPTQKPTFWGPKNRDYIDEFWENYEIVPVNKASIDVDKLKYNIENGDEKNSTPEVAQISLDALENKQVFRSGIHAFEGKKFPYYQGGENRQGQLQLDNGTPRSFEKSIYVAGTNQKINGNVVKMNDEYVISVSPKTNQPSGNISIKMVLLDQSDGHNYPPVYRVFESDPKTIEAGCVERNQKNKTPEYYIIEGTGGRDSSATTFEAVFDGGGPISICGDQKFQGTDLADSITGSEGKDIIYSKMGNDTLNGGKGDDFMAGGSGNDALFGQAGNDMLDGGPGLDSLYGGEGKDVFFPNEGTALIDGGNGEDSFINTINAVALQTIDMGDGADQITNIGSLKTDEGILMGSGDDTLTTNLYIEASVLDGGKGSDTLILNNDTEDGVTGNELEQSNGFEIKNFETIKQTGGTWDFDGNHTKSDLLIEGGTTQIGISSRSEPGLKIDSAEFSNGANLLIDLSMLNINDMTGEWSVIQGNVKSFDSNNALIRIKGNTYNLTSDSDELKEALDSIPILKVKNTGLDLII